MMADTVSNPRHVCGVRCVRDDENARGRTKTPEEVQFQRRLDGLYVYAQRFDIGSTFVCGEVDALDTLVQTGALPRRRAAYMASTFQQMLPWGVARTTLYLVMSHHEGRTCGCLRKMLSWGTCVHVVGLEWTNYSEIQVLHTPAFFKACRDDELVLFGAPPWPKQRLCKAGARVCRDVAGVDARPWVRWHPRHQKRAWLVCCMGCQEEAW